jgi:putative ubiquitin-RnfH superfamily antitoxin RatB of RatAB toxin-antitoxin module
MRVLVVYAAPGVERQVEVLLPANSIVADAVATSGLIDELELAEKDLAYAIFGQRARLDMPLADGDRVELVRPLAADPKDLRRRRAHRMDSIIGSPRAKKKM